MILDIDGFLTSTEFFAALAGLITAILTVLTTNFLSGLFGRTA